MSSPRWYKYLNKKGSDALIGSRGIDTNLLYVWNAGKYSGYAAFYAPAQFYKYFANLQSESRKFHEVIFGQARQKPHYDVDVSVAAWKESDVPLDFDAAVALCLENLITSILEVCSEIGIKVTPTENILLYSSCGRKKASYHVIIDGWASANWQEAGALFGRTRAKFTEKPFGDKMVSWLDGAVYKSVQNFRMLWSYKGDEGEERRWKNYVNPYSYLGTEIVQSTEGEADLRASGQIPLLKSIIFARSLVTFTVSCETIPSIYVAKPKPVYPTNRYLSQEAISMAVGLMHKGFGTHCFQLRNIEGTLINLQRMKPSWCPLCERTHQKEHAYMFVTEGQLFWRCRRLDDWESENGIKEGAKRFHLLGNIEGEVVEVEEEELVEEISDAEILAKLDEPMIREIPVNKKLLDEMEIGLQTKRKG